MIVEFTHTKSSPREVVDQLVAAHAAMVGFKNVPGKLRYELVSEMVKSYAGVESLGPRSDDPRWRSQKRFWDRIKIGVLKALRHYTGHPTDETGTELMTVEQFVAWFRARQASRRLSGQPDDVVVLLLALGDDLGRHQPDPAQHRRRARARPPQRAQAPLRRLSNG